MKKKRASGIAQLALCVAATAVLTACGGGSSGGDSSGSSAPGSTASSSASSLGGTVAIGNALVGAPVAVTDATGKAVTATSGSNGTYSVSITGMTAPFVITATDPSGATGTLYSVVASTTTSSGAPVTANVTPLTTAVAALLTASGNPLTLTQSGGLSAVTPSAVATAVTTLDTALAPVLAANGLSAKAFDPIGGAFTPNQTGADGVIDSVAVTPSASGSGMQITSLADPDTAIQLNSSTTISTALAAPSQPANYLANLVAELGQCMSDVQGGATDTSDTACTSAIDASYLNNGQGTGVAGFAVRHTLLTKGTTLQGVKTVAFLPAGTLPAISNPAALVYFLVTDPNGTPDFASDIVQQLPNGGWNIIGNQQQYNVAIGSFLGRIQFTDSADAGNGRYESGLNIQIPANVTVSGTSTRVGSALVQGPGLPASGLYLLNTAFVPASLTIPSTALTAPWTGCGACAQSNSTTTQYKWDWTSLSGSSTFSPTTADYALQQANVSAIKVFGEYTVTLYSMNGTQIGQPQSVINVAPNIAAAAGATVPWPTLGSDVVSGFLSAGGSQTTAAISALNLDWTVPTTSNAYPNFWASVGIVTAATANGPEEAALNTSWNTPTVTSTSYSETFNPSPYSVASEALSAEAARNVQLGWAADGEFYTSTWQYNH
ncbi:cell wall anchor protein [Paraburkholderia sp. BCC1885]|uniref:cell wall anchor protein n=1 Tax=Paraburkholderia sp. BCC1885 TaxID=2562669 RepID=UPI0021B15D54|nr:cell wall anchor protein [Paraburkholderia sp. BCC1885]